MKQYALFALALVAGLWASPGEAQMQAFSCNGCTPDQEVARVSSIQKRGFYYVYNVISARLRKFEIYVQVGGTNALPDLDAKGGPDGIEVARATVTDSDEKRAHAEAAGAKAAPANWERIVVERTVDPSVARIFDTIVELEQTSPGMLTSAKRTRVPIGNVGQVPGDLGPRNYDPRTIAWQANGGGEHTSFMERIAYMLTSRESANRLHPSLGKALYDVQGESKSASISVGTGLSVGIAFDRIRPDVPVKVCDAQDNCVLMTLTNTGRGIQVTFEKVIDATETPLPAKAKSLEVEWDSRGGRSAAEYAAWVQARARGNTLDIIGGSSGCRGFVLACTSIPDTTLLACSLQCQ